MTEFDIRVRLAQAIRDHRELDEAIIAMQQAALPDQLQLIRMKRQKLRLKDEIAAWERRLIPDIIA